MRNIRAEWTGSKAGSPLTASEPYFVQHFTQRLVALDIAGTMAEREVGV